MAKSEARLNARLLRRKGESIKKIAALLNVSPGSVSMWCRDIILTDEQLRALEMRSRDPNYGKRAIYLKKVKDLTKKKIEILHNEGLQSIGRLNKREKFIAGVALYWAEGFKKDKQLGYANSDPKKIRFFLNWLQESLGVEPINVRARIVINQNYADEIDRITQFWTKESGINLEQFQKPIIQHVGIKKKYENTKQYSGVLRIRVNKSLEKLRILFGQMEGLNL